MSLAGRTSMRRWGFLLIAFGVVLVPSGAGAAVQNADPLKGAAGQTGAPQLVWQYDFGASGLTLRSRSNPTEGAWMPNDETWQNATQGYEDFAARRCPAEDVASGVCNMVGGTFDINPDDPAMKGVSPFAVENGALTISAFRTPASLVPAIMAEIAEQGGKGPAPSFVGGRLTTNPNSFPGFTYGYFEFSVAFPNAGPGMFPALWFYATPGANAKSGKGRAEIDLLEFLGASGRFETTVVYAKPGDAHGEPGGVKVGHWPGFIDGKFHSYGMDWTADHIDFYFDRGLMYSAPASAVAWFRGVSLSPVMDYVIDAPWMTSNVNLQANASTPDPLKMVVKTVRLYDRKPF